MRMTRRSEQCTYNIVNYAIVICKSQSVIEERHFTRHTFTEKQLSRHDASHYVKDLLKASRDCETAKDLNIEARLPAEAIHL